MDQEDEEASIANIDQVGRYNPIITALSSPSIESIQQLLNKINKFTIEIKEKSTLPDVPNSLFAVINRDGVNVTLTFKKNGIKLKNDETSDASVPKNKTLTDPNTNRRGMYLPVEFTEFLGKYFKRNFRDTEHRHRSNFETRLSYTIPLSPAYHKYGMSTSLPTRTRPALTTPALERRAAKVNSMLAEARFIRQRALERRAAEQEAREAEEAAGADGPRIPGGPP